MGLTAIECPDGVCHSHHGGHSVQKEKMQKDLHGHGREWCERLAERIYEMSVDTFSQTVMPSLHGSGWQRKHLDWEFKLSQKVSESDEALVEGIINATESFLRSSEVHRLFIQELVQGTFAEASDNKLRVKAIRNLIDNEVIKVLETNKSEIINRVSKDLSEDSQVEYEKAKDVAIEGFDEVEKLLLNHTEAI
tara:strand:- start:2809 stop:3387 length:579 start_codon:yes stop_codon:yes gene_type:complete